LPAAGTEIVETRLTTHLVILIPVFDDWMSVTLLLRRLNELFETRALGADVLLVDDGSRTAVPPELADCSWYTQGLVRVLHLHRNLGHQTAIAIGLSYLEAQVRCDAVLIMDGDGEDSPADALRLIDAFEREHDPVILFAERTYRSEGWGFRTGYSLYRLAHRLLTGRRIRFGNFSIVPQRVLPALVRVPELWVHYAAAVIRSRLAFKAVPTRRSRRLAGDSKMNLTSLTLHAIRAFAVCSDVIATRVLLASVACLAGGLGLLGALMILRLCTDWTLPGWSSTIGGLIILLLFQIVGVAAQFALSIAGSAASAPIVPRRDAWEFIHSIQPCSTAASPGDPATFSLHSGPGGAR